MTGHCEEMIGILPPSDVATRWTLASSIAVGSCSLVIMRRLYHIANITTIHVSREDRRRMIIEDIAIGSGFPILEIALCMSQGSVLKTNSYP